MLPKKHRFASRSEIRQVFRSAARQQSTSLTWLSRHSASRTNLPWRAAIIVSKKVAPLATDRNTIRRKISEVLWQHKEKLPTGTDVVILAQKQSISSTFQQLSQEIQAITS